MNRKFAAIHLFISVAVFLTIVPSVNATMYDLGCYPYEQECSHWCWNAGSKSVLQYYSHWPSQTEIANWAIDNGNGWGCSNPPICTINYLDIDNCDRRGIKQILEHYEPYIDATASGGILTLTQIRNNIINDNTPIVIRWEWQSDGEGSGGHFIVIQGVDNSSDNIRIIDPGFGEVLNVTHSWLNDGWNDEETHHHKWSDTLQIDY
jgi:hypothetical protein